MSIIPILTPKRLLGILLKAGFRIIRQKGSHIWLTHPITQRSTTIAMHAKDFSRSMISKILKQTGISIQEFLRFLGK
jgi:predicted RNA binding protein YcfA (HicA-like mRNA interferase family)